MTARRLPFTLTPLPGEAFEVWAYAYAARLRLSIRELLTTLGLPRPIHGRWQRPALTEEAIARIGAATGLDTAAVAGMFRTTGQTPTVAMLTAWAPQPASRFCPACLADPDTGWSPDWRLRLRFFCLRHRAPLAEFCPECGARPHGSRLRPRAWPGAPPDPAGFATAPLAAAATVCRCDYDLTQAAAPHCPNPDGWAAAQQFIVRLLSEVRDPAGSIGSRQGALDGLADLTLIAAHLATLHGRSRQPEPAITMLRGDTLTEAAALLHQGGEGADGLIGLVANYETGRTAKAIPHTWNRASPALRTRISRARAQAGSLTPLDRMRYATSLPAPRLLPPRAPGRADPAIRRADLVPDQLWPGWAIRLADDDNLESGSFRVAAAVALLLPHSGLELKTQIIPLLNAQITPNTVHHQIGHLLRLPGGEAALHILTELAFALDEHGAPIDYARRRRLAARARLLTAPAWERIAAEAPGGPGRSLPNARRYVYELLTGGSLRIAPAPYRHTNAATRWDRYREFVTYMPHGLVDALHQHARRVLDTAGITSEPVTWEPPAEWVSTTAWPGADPADTDPASIHTAILQHHRSVHAVAAERQVSVEHIRTVLRTHSLPEPGRPLPTRSRTIHAPGPGTVRHAEQDTARFRVDPAWLHEEYVTWRRSLPDIAAEIGCNLSVLSVFAHAHRIPIRDGAPTHDSIDRDALGERHPSELPRPLRDAICGLHTRLRLERFVTIAGQPSLARAAQVFGCSPGNLSAQLGILERAVGTRLLHRDPRTRSVAGLTPTGQQLYDQAREHLDIEPLDGPSGRGGTTAHLPSDNPTTAPETSRSALPPRRERTATI